MNDENTTKIGNFIGEFLALDRSFLHARNMKYIQVQVSLDTTQALKSGCTIKRENGDTLWISFKYERLSDFCYGCGRIDHTEKACSTTGQAVPHPLAPTSQYGQWLQATKRQSAGQSSPPPTVVSPLPDPRPLAIPSLFDTAPFQGSLSVDPSISRPPSPVTHSDMESLVLWP